MREAEPAPGQIVRVLAACSATPQRIMRQGRITAAVPTSYILDKGPSCRGHELDVVRHFRNGVVVEVVFGPTIGNRSPGSAAVRARRISSSHTRLRRAILPPVAREDPSSCRHPWTVPFSDPRSPVVGNAFTVRQLAQATTSLAGSINGRLQRSFGPCPLGAAQSRWV